MRILSMLLPLGIKGEIKLKLVEIKKKNKTIYKLVPDDWRKQEADNDRGDLTTGGRKSISINLTDDQYKNIFRGKDHGN